MDYLHLHVVVFPTDGEGNEMRQNDQRIYRTFEEFEREELRRTDTDSYRGGASVDDMIATLFNEAGQELDFEAPRKKRSTWDDDDE
jgi:hypothetical protein